MIIEQLRNYIRKERVRGVAPEEIRDALLKQGEHRTKLQLTSLGVPLRWMRRFV